MFHAFLAAHRVARFRSASINVSAHTGELLTTRIGMLNSDLLRLPVSISKDFTALSRDSSIAFAITLCGTSYPPVRHMR